MSYILPFDPLLTAAIFLALLKRIQPHTMMSGVFTFDLNPDHFSSSQVLHGYVRSHGKYGALVSSEGDGTIIDFLSIWESTIGGTKAKCWFNNVASEKALHKDGWLYTVEGKDEFIECLEGIYSRERKKYLAIESLKTSTFTIKKNLASNDSLHTLSNEPADEILDDKKQQDVVNAEANLEELEFLQRIMDKEEFDDIVVGAPPSKTSTLEKAFPIIKMTLLALSVAVGLWAVFITPLQSQ